MAEKTTPSMRTLVDLMRQQAERYRDKVAFSFSYNGDDEDKSQLTYRELDMKARAIAYRLQQHGAPGRRVLVFCRPGLGHIAGFFGCVYAGAIPVPVHEKLAPRMASVVPDAQASFALAAPETPAKVKTAVDRLVGVIDGQPLRWGLTDATVEDAEKWVAPDIDASTTALMQYTSGSTRAPKGIVVSHHNLLHNLAAIRQVWHDDDHTIGVHWLPQHHDMGLIGASLVRLYVGCTTVLMSPAAFITRPMRWLEAMSRHRATVTAAPNFAYDLCVERSSAKERAALDLSNWSTAMCGGEPVRAATLRGFAEAFAPAGFRPEAFHPTYGLAESTVLVSGGSNSPAPVVHHIDRSALGENRVVDAPPEESTAVALVGCGQPQGGQRVIIVNPDTRRECAPDEVGEIWVAGSSVAQGYWGRPDETEQTFSAYLAETDSDSFLGPFLRTGDLGFLRAGELFITGRCKDLVIIRGDNYYPNDIEMTVQDCHPALLSGRGAVFAVMPESGAAEELVVVQEVALPRVSGAELAEMVEAIQTAISEHHGIHADSVVLVGPMRIPTTSSGKIQRGQCRQQFVDGDLETVAEWHAASPPTDDNALSSAIMKSFTNDRDPVAAARVAELIETSAQQYRASRQA
jgi:acyl-CoA synthetase (AMP-forming)/AMP-acid ligase II